ncbi:2-oxoglutarate and iron-dependent oxygenase domain-containing protein [Nonomuraea typhae]|uniref:2-oxoglutarate and iron-dependent oxygenase domain-containing protein n=1 Tax=Nonomuraea typhae TaxID=2603600 RepID=UPI0012F957E4|nr:2-oxoglutarate and iron-dependent oxygenase domain-containing protein [Nonomuraea typhae]
MTELRTFDVPEAVTGSRSDVTLGRTMVETWRTDGVFQVTATTAQQEAALAAFEASWAFFALPREVKSRFVSDLTYSGYAASDEEAGGETDCCESFTIFPDVPVCDLRVHARWPGHGPVPWPGSIYRRRMTAFTAGLGALGDQVLRLVALGLQMDAPGRLTGLTTHGWHQLRAVRFPPRIGRGTRGIGAHTDYGLLVITTQDEVGGMYVRPPVDGEKRPRNWLPGESTDGMYAGEEPWVYVRPRPRTFTVHPGDLLQLLTGGLLPATPNRADLADAERHAMTYFHEPGFGSLLEDPYGGEPLHYGTHVTNVLMRRHPDRPATRRILREGRLTALRLPCLR